MANQGYDQFFNKRKQASRTGHETVPAKKKSIVKNGIKFRPKQRKIKPMPIKPIVACGFLLLSALFASSNEITIAKFFERLEIGIFSQGQAQQAKNDKAVKKAEKSSLDKFEEDKKSKKLVKKQWTQEEVKLFSTLEDRKNSLDQREAELEELEIELVKQRDQLQKKLTKLEKLRTGISEKLEVQVSQDDEKVMKLVNVYSSMKPAQAAKIMEKIDETLAIKILARMKKKSAAEVLNILKPEKARRLSEKYVGYISMN